jgi:phosphopantothenoylcysteine synthetase/decarboxylase
LGGQGEYAKIADTKPKRFALVLMPFSEAFDDIYKLAIKPACEIEQLALRISTSGATREYLFQVQVLLNQKTKSMEINQGAARQGAALDGESAALHPRQ